jgi:hypothetical protein
MGYSSGFYFIYLINLFFEAEVHLFILGLGECEEKEIEFTHTKTTNLFSETHFSLSSLNKLNNI